MKSKIILGAVLFLAVPVQSQTTLAVQTHTINGLAATYSAARSGAGLKFANDGKTVLHIKNAAAGGTTTVTIDSQRPPAVGYTVTDATMTVADGAEKFMGPFNMSAFNNASGQVVVTFSDTVGVTIAAIKLPISTP